MAQSKEILGHIEYHRNNALQY